MNCLFVCSVLTWEIFDGLSGFPASVLGAVNAIFFVSGSPRPLCLSRCLDQLGLPWRSSTPCRPLWWSLVTTTPSCWSSALSMLSVSAPYVSAGWSSAPPWKSLDPFAPLWWSSAPPCGCLPRLLHPGELQPRLLCPGGLRLRRSGGPLLPLRHLGGLLGMHQSQGGYSLDLDLDLALRPSPCSASAPPPSWIVMLASGSRSLGRGYVMIWPRTFHSSATRGRSCSTWTSHYTPNYIPQPALHLLITLSQSHLQLINIHTCTTFTDLNINHSHSLFRAKSY